MIFWRVHCSSCGKSFSPLQRFIQLERYQTKTNELEKLIVETVSETSYRRGVAQLSRAGKAKIPYHTANDWVQKTDCDEIDISPHVIGTLPIQIMPDGTGFKGNGENGQARKGDLKVVIGSFCRIRLGATTMPLAYQARLVPRDVQKWRANSRLQTDSGCTGCCLGN